MTLMSPEDLEQFQEKLERVIKDKDALGGSINKSIHVGVLENEIEYLKSQFQDHDTGHLRTAVSVLENRVRDLRIQM